MLGFVGSWVCSMVGQCIGRVDGYTMHCICGCCSHVFLLSSSIGGSKLSANTQQLTCTGAYGAAAPAAASQLGLRSVGGPCTTLPAQHRLTRVTQQHHTCQTRLHDTLHVMQRPNTSSCKVQHAHFNFTCTGAPQKGVALCVHPEATTQRKVHNRLVHLPAVIE